MTSLSTQTEVEGSLVSVLLAEYDDASTEWTRTVLSQATKEDLSISFDESSEEFDQGSFRRNKRYRVSNTIDVEIATAVATDLDALESLGVVNSNGKATWDTDSRRITNGGDTQQALELAYWKDEPDFSSVDVEADSEILNRFTDVKVVVEDLDPSSTPPLMSLMMWVEGGFWFDYQTT